MPLLSKALIFLVLNMNNIRARMHENAEMHTRDYVYMLVKWRSRVELICTHLEVYILYTLRVKRAHSMEGEATRD